MYKTNFNNFEQQKQYLETFVDLNTVPMYSPLFPVIDPLIAADDQCYWSIYYNTPAADILKNQADHKYCWNGPQNAENTFDVTKTLNSIPSIPKRQIARPPLLEPK